MAKLPPDVRAHVHRDQEVDLDRVRDFERATPEIKLRVLAVLRAQSSDDSLVVELAIAALSISVVAIGIAPSGLNLTASGIFGSVGSGLVLGGTAVIALSPIIVAAVLHIGRRQRATIWMRAFEDAEAERLAGITPRASKPARKTRPARSSRLVGQPRTDQAKRGHDPAEAGA